MGNDFLRPSLWDKVRAHTFPYGSEEVSDPREVERLMKPDNKREISSIKKLYYSIADTATPETFLVPVAIAGIILSTTIPFYNKANQNQRLISGENKLRDISEDGLDWEVPNCYHTGLFTDCDSFTEDFEPR
jgi:hypothetical protein